MTATPTQLAIGNATLHVGDVSVTIPQENVS